MRLSHRHKSMIASAIAGQQPLCCEANADVRELIAPNSAEIREWIAGIAYDYAGCATGLKSMDDRWARWLDSILNVLAGE